MSQHARSGAFRIGIPSLLKLIFWALSSASTTPGKGTRDDSWMLSLGQQAPPRNETPLLPPPRKRWVTSKKEDDEQEEDEDENKVEDENEDDNPGPS